MSRFIGLGVVVFAAAVALGMFATPAQAQVQICSGTGFATASGTTACSGAAAPVVASATVRTSARLTLESVFGINAAALTASFGNVDAFCLTAPGAGITCANDTATSAVWYGDVAFRVRMSGMGAQTAKLTGLVAAGGTIPANQLLDGGSGAQPATPYTAVAMTLQGTLGNGSTTVTRGFGVKVTSADAAAAWSSNVQYSVVIE